MSPMYKGTKLYSILNLKCPQCHKGNFFIAHPYKVSTMGKLNKRCSKCNKKFELETGFYQGSYYVSYALGVALFITVVGLNYIFKDTITPASLMISFVIALILLLPMMYSLSKIIWANIFMKYDKDAMHNYKISLQNDSRAKK